jgi:hypothetical protein
MNEPESLVTKHVTIFLKHPFLFANRAQDFPYAGTTSYKAKAQHKEAKTQAKTQQSMFQVSGSYAV